MRVLSADRVFGNFKYIFIALLVIGLIYLHRNSFTWGDSSTKGSVIKPTENHQDHAPFRPIPPEPFTIPTDASALKDVNWRQYATVHTVLDQKDLCATLILLYDLISAGSRVDHWLIFPKEWEEEKETTIDPEDRTGPRMRSPAELLEYAENELGAGLKLIPMVDLEGIEGVVRVPGEADTLATWDWFRKTLPFILTRYVRVLALNPGKHFTTAATKAHNLDPLFLSTPLKSIITTSLSSSGGFLDTDIMLIAPSKPEYTQLKPNSQILAPDGFLTQRFGKKSGTNGLMLFPKKGFQLNMAFLRDDGYEANKLKREYYPGEDWNPIRAVREALVVSLDDGRLDASWISSNDAQLQKLAPLCHPKIADGEDCNDRNTWLKVYRGYLEKRKKICKAM